MAVANGRSWRLTAGARLHELQGQRVILERWAMADRALWMVLADDGGEGSSAMVGDWAWAIGNRRKLGIWTVKLREADGPSDKSEGMGDGVPRGGEA
ncbi:unnamed protein product [Calypogeia fissa]